MSTGKVTPLRAVRMKAFEATSTSKRLDDWDRTSFGPNAVNDDADISRARSQDSVRNNPWINNALDLIVTNQVGCGIQPRPKIDDAGLRADTLELFESWASGIVMNPIDMAAIELSKDTTGRYIIGNPQGTIQKNLWGLPVVETQAMGVDKALVGAFNMAAQIFDRQDATIDVSTEDQDNFVKNKVTIRAEERLALVIWRPQALVYGDLGRVV